MTAQMTKGERDDLLRLVRQRERVAKTAAEQRSSILLADFEAKISAVHAFNKDEVWKDAHAAAERAFAEANAKIAARATELGIPEEFQPRLYMQWARRGENELKERQAELRRVAKAEIAALEKSARVKIEADSVHAQTEILANGLTSETAKQFLERLSAVETLMPVLDVSTVEQKLLEKNKARRADYFALN